MTIKSKSFCWNSLRLTLLSPSVRLHLEPRLSFRSTLFWKRKEIDGKIGFWKSMKNIWTLSNVVKVVFFTQQGKGCFCCKYLWLYHHNFCACTPSNNSMRFERKWRGSKRRYKSQPNWICQRCADINQNQTASVRAAQRTSVTKNCQANNFTSSLKFIDTTF